MRVNYSGNLRQRLRAARQSAQLSVAELAQLSGIPTGSIIEAETGRTVRRGYECLKDLAKALKVTHAWLAFGTGEEPRINEFAEEKARRLEESRKIACAIAADREQRAMVRRHVMSAREREKLARANEREQHRLAAEAEKERIFVEKETARRAAALAIQARQLERERAEEARQKKQVRAVRVPVRDSVPYEPLGGDHFYVLHLDMTTDTDIRDDIPYMRHRKYRCEFKPQHQRKA